MAKSSKLTATAKRAVNVIPRSHRFKGNVVSIHGLEIRIKNVAARADESPFKVFHMQDYLLPATPFSLKPTTVADHSELRSAIFNAAIELDGRMDPRSKSNVLRFSANLRCWVKVLEFGWLNGLYALSDWTPAAARKLLELLSQSGWTGALQLQRRTQVLIASGEADTADLIQASKSKSFRYSMTEKFNQMIGTNSKGSELIPCKVLIMSHLGLEGVDDQHEDDQARRKRERSFDEGMGQSDLRAKLGCINVLGEMKDGIKFIPFPDTARLSNEFGRAGRRTKNLDPGTAALLLKEANWWIEHAAGPLLDLLEDVVVGMKRLAKHNREISPNLVLKIIRASKHCSVLEKLVGLNIATVGLRSHGSQQTSLKQIIYAVASSCFVMIAFLNARRRDELQHRKIGLHRKALRRISDELGMYQADFYIEKTFKEYVPFYVGDATVAAIRVLERLSDLARVIDVVRGVAASASAGEYEDKLFQLPRLVGKKDGGGTQWFKFIATSEGQARFFVERALGKDANLRIHPHMFRRGYALIFHYRYENATLQALAQQLGHFDLQMVLLYISDKGLADGESEARAYATRKGGPRNAQREEIDGIRADVIEVGKERVRELVDEIVAGSESIRSRGGFVRLVQRFHQRLGQRLDYSCLEAKDKAKVLADTLLSRGHTFNPLPHANCAVSPLRKSQTAGCYSTVANGVARENASASTCTNCAYSHWVEGHNAAISDDLKHLDEQIRMADGKQSLMLRRQIVEAENLRAALRIRAARLGSLLEVL